MFWGIRGKLETIYYFLFSIFCRKSRKTNPLPPCDTPKQRGYRRRLRRKNLRQKGKSLKQTGGAAVAGVVSLVLDKKADVGAKLTGSMKPTTAAATAAASSTTTTATAATTATSTATPSASRLVFVSH